MLTVSHMSPTLPFHVCVLLFFLLNTFSVKYNIYFQCSKKKMFNCHEKDVLMRLLSFCYQETEM